MLFGIPLTNCGSKNTFGCTNPGLRNSSNDNTRPTTDCVFPRGIGWERGAFDVGVLDVVGESVLVWVSVLAVGVVSELCTEFGVCTVTGEDWVAGADVVELGLVGLDGFAGETGFVGLLVDFLQLLDVVTQGCHVGLPYGFGHIEERVWIMLPV
jgi:hypothetical protein